MRVSYRWLRSLVDVSTDPHELSRILTMQGVTVDEVEPVRSPLKDIIVGVVEEVSKHPNADRLLLCKVNTGENTFEVVCGAPNVRAGGKYPFAPVGAVIPDGTKIKKGQDPG